ncbi:MAG: hypothetical protein J6Y94_05080 [Bacteriovoracaceae bacterium]|nr:hypothetical protein [Bacteriovoracaceae bacterium]
MNASTKDLLGNGYSNEMKVIAAQVRRRKYFKLPWYAYPLIIIQAILLLDGILTWNGIGLLWPLILRF